MYTGFPHHDECDRTRELASRRLDGDLTEFDVGALRTHLRECAECAAVVAAMERVTHRIRGATRLEPAPPRPVVVAAPRRSGRSRHRLAVTAAAIAAAAAAAGAGAIVASQAQHSAAQTSHTTKLAELAPLDHQFRSIHEGRLLLVLPPRVRSPHQRGVLA